VQYAKRRLASALGLSFATRSRQRECSHRVRCRRRTDGALFADMVEAAGGGGRAAAMPAMALVAVIRTGKTSQPAHSSVLASWFHSSAGGLSCVGPGTSRSRRRLSPRRWLCSILRPSRPRSAPLIVFSPMVGGARTPKHKATSQALPRSRAELQPERARQNPSLVRQASL